MPLDILTPDQLAKVRDAALRKADWYAARGPVQSHGPLVNQFYAEQHAKLVQGLRRTAADAQAAIDGCEASLRSVQHELDDVPAVAA